MSSCCVVCGICWSGSLSFFYLLLHHYTTILPWLRCFTSPVRAHRWWFVPPYHKKDDDKRSSFEVVVVPVDPASNEINVTMKFIRILILSVFTYIHSFFLLLGGVGRFFGWGRRWFFWWLLAAYLGNGQLILLTVM